METNIESSGVGAPAPVKRRRMPSSAGKFSARLDRKVDTHYKPYGKPILRMICKHYGWDPEQWSDKY